VRTATRPDVVILLTDEERAAPPYESGDLARWRESTLTGRRWFSQHAVSFERHYTGSLACVPSRPTLFTGQYPDVHGVTQTNGLGKMHDDSRMRWLRPDEVPTLGHWFRAAGYDTHYVGKWHMSHADLPDGHGGSLATNDEHGMVDDAAVRAYLDADMLAPFGFGGWVGPEPHGDGNQNAGFVRDPIYADRAVAWLRHRYARRREGDSRAAAPFLLVVSFVNPHDIVLFPAWARRSPLAPAPALEPPDVPPSPTDGEDLSNKPAAQIAYREAYPSAYGPPAAIERVYRRSGQYRRLYYRLHAEVDAPLDRVRRAVTEGGSELALLVRTSDHGEALGAHGGLHQKWFNLYDEVTRVPFQVARIGAGATTARAVHDMPTSHVDLVPTLLSAAGIDAAVTGGRLAERFTEVHPLPGRDLLPIVDGDEPSDRSRTVYLLTRDNMLEGDSGASGLARRLGRVSDPPMPLRIQLPAHVAANFEGVVGRADDGHLWKLVRTFDDPDTWTEPGVRHLAANGPGGEAYRTRPLRDQWELYDLHTDPIEAHNRWADADADAVRAAMEQRLSVLRGALVPARNHAWPNAARRRHRPLPNATPPRPALALRRLLQRVGLHPDDDEAEPSLRLPNRRALVVATNHGALEVGKPTGVFASEMTVPYYLFRDAGMVVDVASPRGGLIPVDPQSLRPVLRTASDDRFLSDPELQAAVMDSLAIGDVDIDRYDLVYLAGGWGAAFDFGSCRSLGEQLTRANRAGAILGGVCHGPLGLCNALGTDGRPLVENRRVSAVTDKQVHELGIHSTPHHPETELRARGALFESQTRFRDPLANHWVADGNLITGQNQNAAPMVAREMMQRLAQ
jgi:arylsulfatase A-like enzyme/putative intracellular protease/amidase